MRTRNQMKKDASGKEYFYILIEVKMQGKRTSRSHEKNGDHSNVTQEENKHKQEIDPHNSQVFKRRKQSEERERNITQQHDVGDTLEGIDEADEKDGKSSKESQDEKDESNNMQVAMIAPTPKITIRDIINSSKFHTRRRRKTEKKEESAKDSESKNETESDKIQKDQTSVPTQVPSTKSGPIRKRIIIVNGKPQIDQSSLLVEQSHFQTAESDPRNYTVINDDDTTNSVIYGKRTHTKKWTPEETEFFYECLQECGTDFSMIEAKFKGSRSRKQIKNKFRKEENEDPSRIDAVVGHKAITQ